MRIAVVGPGAIGCLLAARFAQVGHELSLVARTVHAARALACSGITLHDQGGDRHHFHLPVTDASGGGFPADLVCVCVKAYDTSRAAAVVQRFVGADTGVVSFQNGLTNARDLVHDIPTSQIVCAATGQGVTLTAPGNVRDAGRGETAVAAWVHAGTRYAVRVRDVLAASDMPATLVPDARSVTWSKAVVNCAINPLTALHDVPNGEVSERPDLRRMAVEAVREAASVAAAEGIRLLSDDPVEQMLRVCHTTRDNLSSMLQDVRRGRRTEIDNINGVVLDCARRHGVPAPVNDDLVARVRQLTHSG